MAKTLDLDFTDPQFDGVQTITAQTGADLTVTRASDAAVTDYFNVLKTVPDDEPRFTGGRRVENLWLQSNDFDTTWGNVASVEAQGATDPDGGSTAWTITDDSSTGSGSVGMQQNQTVGGAGTYTQSCYFKKGSLDWAALKIYNWENATTIAYFNINTGVVGTKEAGYDASGIEDAGNGWYRCWASFTIATDFTFNLGINLSDGDNDSAVPKDGTSTLLIYGFQAENVSGQDDPAPSAYIATTTAAKAQWYATKRRTNLILESETLATSPWSMTAVNGAVTADDAANPLDAAVTADRFHGDGAGAGAELVLGKQNHTFGLGVYTFSTYAKADGTDWLRIYSSNLTSADGAYFDLSGSGAVGTKDSGTTAAIEEIGNGWHRCSLQLTIDDGTDLVGQINYVLCSADTVQTVANTDTSKGILFYGAQLEKASTASAYIATTDTVASSDFDTAITPTGLLIEEARTNQCTYSEDFNGADWTAGVGNTRDSDAGTAPNGTTTADRLNVTATDERHSFANFWSSGISASTTYTASCFLKADGDDYACLNMISNQIRGAHAVFTLTGDGTVTEAEAVGSGTYEDSGIENVGNGWYRCWLAFTVGASSDLYFSVSTAGSATPAAYTNGAPDYLAVEGEDILMWGADLETGSFPTSYIKTEASSVTRAGDVVKTTDMSWLNADAGSIYVNYTKSVGNKGGIARLFSLDDDASTANRILSYWVTSNKPSFFGGDWAIDNASNLDVPGTASQQAGGWALNDIAFYLDGSQVGTDTTAAIPTNLLALHIGHKFNETAQISGHIGRFVYYNERLADSVLEDLSNGTFPVAASTGISFSRNLARDLARNLARDLAS